MYIHTCVHIYIYIYIHSIYVYILHMYMYIHINKLTTRELATYCGFVFQR